MSEQFDPHDTWEALFDKHYLRWFHLNGQPALVKIEKIERVELTMRGGITSKKPVLTITQVQGKIEDVKPLVLNVTNGNAIAHIHGARPSQWPGKEIVLYPGTTKMYDTDLKRMKEVGCIRIRAKADKASK